MAVVDEVVERLGEAPPGRPVLDWNELRGLAAEGVTLAPHTRTHPLLNRVSIADAEAEVVGSHADLERELGAAPRVLAYPSGACSDPIAELLGRCGFELAFTIMRHGVNRVPGCDWLRLRRINVSRSLPLPLLRTSLLPVAARVATANPESTG
jgi:peptidoglycan/xylan/chitin deacetylase (PgdA/CDA1 family)